MEYAGDPPLVKASVARTESLDVAAKLLAHDKKRIHQEIISAINAGKTWCTVEVPKTDIHLRRWLEEHGYRVQDNCNGIYEVRW